MIKISVIVAVYNVEKYLDQCLNSLVNQNFSSYEVLVINDGSPDNSEEIIKKYENKFPQIIKYFYKENAGYSHTKNFGIKKSRGEYIIFVDGDDWVEKNYLAALYKYAKKRNLDIAICNFYNVYGNRKVKNLSLRRSITKKGFYFFIPSSCTKLIKKKLFIDNNIYFPEDIWYEDMATSPRLVTKARKIGYIDKSLYNYRRHDSSIMSSVNEKLVIDHKKSLDILYDDLLKQDIFKNYKKQYEMWYINTILGIYKKTKVNRYHNIWNLCRKHIMNEYRNKFNSNLFERLLMIFNMPLLSWITYIKLFIFKKETF